MGVSGSGKSTLASALAKQLDFILIEADDFHSEEAIALMQSGQPLNDTLREPWITRLEQELLKRKQHNQSCVLAYSGLRREHRSRLFNTGFRTFPYLLQVDLPTLQQRMKNRPNHFMPASLLQSQLAAMEVPVADEHITELFTKLSTKRQGNENDLTTFIEKIKSNLNEN